MWSKDDQVVFKTMFGERKRGQITEVSEDHGKEAYRIEYLNDKGDTYPVLLDDIVEEV